MKKITEALQAEAKKLLESKAVDLVIAWEQGSDLVHMTPLFVDSIEKVDKIKYNPFAANNLATFLLDFTADKRKVGLVVKGCDSRAVNRLVQDLVIPREQVVVIGVPCGGVLDWKKVLPKVDPNATLEDVVEQGDNYVLKTSAGEVTLPKAEFQMKKCFTCENPVAVVSDVKLGEGERPGKVQDFAEIKAFEAKTPAEKNEFWEKEFSRCIRCYACRNVCPACSCRECVFDSAEPVWTSKRTTVTDNTNFHLTRAMHVASRCVDCGECERVCPVDIPLRLINQKIGKDLKELFDMSTPGQSVEDNIALGRYNQDDPEEFM